MEMSFDERLYAEMAAFFSEQMAADALLIGMSAAWQRRFQQDFADCAFAAAAWEEALPAAWHGRFSLIVLAGFSRAAERRGRRAVPKPMALERLSRVACGRSALRDESLARRAGAALLLSRSGAPCETRPL